MWPGEPSERNRGGGEGKRCGRGPNPWLFTWLFLSKAGFSPDLESTRMWEASLENAKQPPFGICDIRSIWLQVPSFPRARPRMCRREDWVAALNLIEAHSHTLSSFRRIKL